LHLLVVYLCRALSTRDFMIDNDKKQFLDKVNEYVLKIAKWIITNDPAQTIDIELTKCRNEMEQFIIEFHGRMKEDFFRNRLIFALRDAIQLSVHGINVAPNPMFDIAESKFLELFKYKLHLHENSEQPEDSDDEPDYIGPSSGVVDDVTDGPMNIYEPRGRPHGAGSAGVSYELIILQNLHRRIGDLEKRIGAR
jgi:hypothetical protein